MTTINFVPLAESISGIDLSSRGIHSRKLEEIPTSAMTECPLFAPRPRGFVSELGLTRRAFGSDGNEPMDLIYTMTWTYLHAPIGSILSFAEYGRMVENIAYILEQLANNDSFDEAVDVSVQNITDIGGIQDAAGNLYHGAEITLRVTEFING